MHELKYTEPTVALERALGREEFLRSMVGAKQSDGTPHPLGVLGSKERRNYLRRGGEMGTRPTNPVE